jgi:hypothetical protein
MEGGRVAEACQKFSDSLALERRGGTLLNLAVCREAEGRYATALGFFEEAREVALKEGRAGRVALADHHLALVRSKLSWLTVRLGQEATVPSLAIVCDNEEIPAEAWGKPRAVDAGQHTIIASAPGRLPFRITIVAGPAGDNQTVEIPALGYDALSAPNAIAAVSSAAGPPKLVDAPHGGAASTTWRVPVGWTAIGVGVVTLALGGAEGVSAIVGSRQSRSACPGTMCPDPAYRENQSAITDADIADVTIPLGVVAAAAGIYFLVASRSSKTTTGTTLPLLEARPDPLPANVVASVGPGGASILWRGVW